MKKKLRQFFLAIILGILLFLSFSYKNIFAFLVFLIILFFVLLNKLKKKFVFSIHRRKNPVKQSEALFKQSDLITKYLKDLHGIEIGASRTNSFQLDRSINVNYEDCGSDSWEGEANIKPEIVNLVANGDDLPFKDNTLDYVLSSHVFEHFFDPIKVLNEWIRVLKPGGYIAMIIPHKDRTFDKDRDVTSLDELIKRHNGDYKISDYAYMTDEKKIQVNFVKQGCDNSDNPHILIKDGSVPDGYTRFVEDDHHHWNVWTTQDVVEICKYLNLKIIECHDVDDKVGNGFTIIIQK